MTEDVHKQLQLNLKKIREAGIKFVGRKLRVESYGGRTREDEQAMKEKERRKRWYLHANRKVGWTK